MAFLVIPRYGITKNELYIIKNNLHLKQIFKKFKLILQFSAKEVHSPASYRNVFFTLQ